MRIQAVSWSRFRSNWLAVSREVVGRSHKFEFEERHIEIKLPREEHANLGKGYDETIRCFEWTGGNGKNPLNFDIFKVDVIIELQKPIQIPRKLLELPPTQRRLTSHRKGDLFDTIVSNHEELANKAFEYWIRIVRWKAGWWRIGQPEVGDHRSGWSTHLMEKQSRHRFWSGPVRIVAQLPHVLNTAEWNSIQQAVTDSRFPPIWIEFLYDSQHKLDIGDNSGCILSLAIACESIFRHLFNQQIPMPERAEERLFTALSEINIRAICRNITKFEFWDRTWRNSIDWEDINKIFHLRNRVVHLGINVDRDSTSLPRLVSSAEKFIKFADRTL